MISKFFEPRSARIEGRRRGKVDEEVLEKSARFLLVTCEKNHAFNLSLALIPLGNAAHAISCDVPTRHAHRTYFC